MVLEQGDRMNMNNINALNSATKYPSIPTYHAIGDRGVLSGEAEPFPEGSIVTEKIDGTNARVVLFGDGDWIIGSREELLHAKGDRIYNPALGIVDAVREYAEAAMRDPRHKIIVVYGEVYGHKIGAAAKNYTTSDQVGFRPFDVASIDPAILDRDVREIAAWRESGGQYFFPYDLREPTPIEVPVLNASPPPTDIAGTYDWLRETVSATRCAMGCDGGQAEGVVIRTPDRSRIAKIRFDDYRRTLGKRA